MIAEMHPPNVVTVTEEDGVLSNRTISLDEMGACNNEEADIQLFLHAKDAAEEGSRVVMIKASDTDVLVIAVSVRSSLQEIGLQQLLIAFGQGRTLCTTSTLQYVRRRLKGFSSSMPSLVVMLRLPFEAREEVCMADMGGVSKGF